MIKKVAILANGGDVSGFNAVIRAIVKTAEKNNVECYGIIEGYRGLVNNEYIKLDTANTASGILPKGGSIIGSSTNSNVFHYKVEENGKVEYKDLSDKCVQNIKENGFDCIFTLGGDGTQKSARDLSLKGINVIGVPKTIDNDVACTDITFGYNTAVSVATEALDRLHTTGETHHRIMVLEVMGRYAGWIALESAIAGGADIALIPEIPYNIESAVEKIKHRISQGKRFSVVVVAEGAMPKGGEISVEGTRDNGKGVDNTKLGGAGASVAKELENLTGLEARSTTLGYMQRGGTPTAFDRVLSTKYGAKAMELAIEGKFGVLAVLKNGVLDSVSLEEVVGDNKIVGAVSGNTKESNIRKVTMEHDLVKTARNIGICLGD
ncbi:MAG: ATP-dependent 6-phosphofructokinase [Clostridia bacterium]|jgi:phosphofructokinase-like protein|nr:ATP-dependent 6-phosphofructokinase [Clostridia bacterium]